MRTSQESADGLRAIDAEHNLTCRNSRCDCANRLRTVLSLPVLSAVAVLMLAACSESREPSIEVAAATVAQYENTCGLCHENGDGGAPVTGDTEDWEERVAKGMRKVHENAVVGYEGATGIMPAKGGYENLTDEEVIAIVDYMVDVSR